MMTLNEYAKSKGFNLTGYQAIIADEYKRHNIINRRLPRKVGKTYLGVLSAAYYGSPESPAYIVPRNGVAEQVLGDLKVQDRVKFTTREASIGLRMPFVFLDEINPTKEELAYWGLRADRVLSLFTI